MLYFRPRHRLKGRVARLVLIPSGTKSSRAPVIAPLSPEVGFPFLLRIKRRPHQPLRLNCDAEDCHSAVCGAEDRTGTSCCLHACPGDALLLYLTAPYDLTRRKNGPAFLSFIHIMWEGIISCNKNKNLLPRTIILFSSLVFAKLQNLVFLASSPAKRTLDWLGCFRVAGAVSKITCVQHSLLMKT